MKSFVGIRSTAAVSVWVALFLSTASTGSSASWRSPSLLASSTSTFGVTSKPVSFVTTVHRGGSLESSKEAGSDGEEEAEVFYDAVQEEGDNGDAVANEEKSKESSSTNDDEDVADQSKGDEEGLDDPSIDEHSSANIDRMDYADAYDEEVEAEDGEEGSSDLSDKVDSQTASGVADVAGAAAPTTESVDEAVAAAAQEGHSGKIPLVSTITPAMKDILIKQLKYRRNEVRDMRPEIAAVVVAKELQRPQEGLPEHWLVKEEKASVKNASTKKSIIVSVVAVLLAAVGGVLLSSSSSSGGSDFVWEPAASSAISAATSALYDTPSEPEADEPEPEKESEPLLSPPVEHEHSLRPGERPPSEPIDETFLDKFLTKVEKALGKLFSR